MSRRRDLASFFIMVANTGRKTPMQFMCRSTHVEVCRFLGYNHPQSRIRSTAKRYSHTFARPCGTRIRLSCISNHANASMVSDSCISDALAFARRYVSSKTVPCLSFKRGSLLIQREPFLGSRWRELPRNETEGGHNQYKKTFNVGGCRSFKNCYKRLLYQSCFNWPLSTGP